MLGKGVCSLQAITTAFSMSWSVGSEEAPSPQHRAPSFFFGSGEMAPSPQRKKNLCWLLFISSCLSLAAARRRKRCRASRCVIVWRRWLCFRCNCCNCARLRKKAFFAAVHFCCHQPAAGVHVRIYLPAARARRAGAATRAHAESFGGWGVLLCCCTRDTTEQTPGIEPMTSSTLRRNHTPRPSGQKLLRDYPRWGSNSRPWVY